MTATVTTSGLQDLTNPAAAALPGQWALASGSSDVITASYSVPNTGLTDGLLLGIRGFTANLTSTPTFSPDGLTPATIVKDSLAPLNGGDIVANGEYLLRYNLPHNVWVLLNPHTP